MDNILDHVVVQGQRYDIVSPTAFGDYIETIGSACINPDGYAQGSTFLAKLGNEQFYYEATAAITQDAAINEGTNCKKTTVTGRESELASDIQTLSNKADKVLVITLPNVSTSKLSFTSTDVAAIANVTADHVVIESVLSNPAAQASDWTVTTASNSIIISGTVASGATTNLTLTLIKKAS